MSFVVSEGANFTPAPEGLWQAVCVDVVDLGMVTSKTYNKAQRRALLVFQISEVDPENGERFQVRRSFGATLGKKGKLRPFLESWRGGAFKESDLEGFDLERLVGVNCKLQIIHAVDDGTTYANIVTVIPFTASANEQPMVAVKYVRDRDRPKEEQLAFRHGGAPAQQAQKAAANGHGPAAANHASPF